jgi:hypothetical protein
VVRSSHNLTLFVKSEMAKMVRNILDGAKGAI